MSASTTPSVPAPARATLIACGVLTSICALAALAVKQLATFGAGALTHLTDIRVPFRTLFLDHGRITEHGNHDTLLAAGGTYARFGHERVHVSGRQLR